jgi:hypothetical protein
MKWRGSAEALTVNTTLRKVIVSAIEQQANFRAQLIYIYRTLRVNTNLVLELPSDIAATHDETLVNHYNQMH